MVLDFSDDEWCTCFALFLVFSFVDGGVMRSDQIRMGLFFGFRLSFCLWVSVPLDFHGFVYLLMMGFRIYGG